MKTLIWTILLLAGLASQLWLEWPPWRADQLSAIAGWTLLIVAHLYHSWSWLYLSVQRTLLWLTNTTTHWSLDVRLKPVVADEEGAQDVSNRLQEKLEARYASQIHIRRLDPDEFDFRIEHQFHGRVSVVAQDGEPRIELLIGELAVGFRDSLRRLRDHICPLIEEVESDFRIGSGERIYNLTAHFSGNNPYFGVFIQKLKVSEVDAFNLIIKSPREAGGHLTVSTDTISLTSRSLSAFRTQLEGLFSLANQGV